MKRDTQENLRLLEQKYPSIQLAVETFFENTDYALGESRWFLRSTKTLDDYLLHKVFLKKGADSPDSEEKLLEEHAVFLFEQSTILYLESLIACIEKSDRSLQKYGREVLPYTKRFLPLDDAPTEAQLEFTLSDLESEADALLNKIRDDSPMPLHSDSPLHSDWALLSDWESVFSDYRHCIVGYRTFSKPLDSWINKTEKLHRAHKKYVITKLTVVIAAITLIAVVIFGVHDCTK